MGCCFCKTSSKKIDGNKSNSNVEQVKRGKKAEGLQDIKL